MIEARMIVISLKMSSVMLLRMRLRLVMPSAGFELLVWPEVVWWVNVRNVSSKNMLESMDPLEPV